MNPTRRRTSGAVRQSMEACESEARAPQQDRPL